MCMSHLLANVDGGQCTLPRNNGSFFLLIGALKEYVASLIGLYKNNGAVLCAGIFFLHHRTHTDREFTQILS